MLIRRRHIHGGYTAWFNTCTGAFARIEEPGHPEPFWSPEGPELLDVAITNWCDRACEICYRSSSEAGQHMLHTDYTIIMEQAASLGVYQVALGGGNPNQHPDFVSFLRTTREEYGIVPNYTTSGRGLTAEVLAASQRYCGAVAVSAYHPYDETGTAIEQLVTAGVRTNVHFVLQSASIETAIHWLSEPPRFLEGVNAIVFLAYKPVGRLRYDMEVPSMPETWVSFFELVSSGKRSFKVGFDSCLVPAVVTFSNYDPVCFDACEAGRFSMFVSENLELYPCSFMESIYRGNSLRETTMAEEWQTGQFFERTRSQLRNHNCQWCPKSNVCLGGCPAFPELHVCGHRPVTRSGA